VTCEQVLGCLRYFDKLAEIHEQHLKREPSGMAASKTKENKSGSNEKTKELQRSPEARAQRNIEILAAWKAAGPERSIREVSRLVVCSPTTVRTILIAAGLATERTRAPAPKPEGSALYKSIVKEISASKTITQ